MKVRIHPRPGEDLDPTIRQVLGIPPDFELVPLARLGDLDLPVVCDPRRRDVGGALFVHLPDTPKFVRASLTKVEFRDDWGRRRSRNIDEVRQIFCYWHFPGFSCGFSGVGEDARPGWNDSFLAVQKRQK